jgi:hypothetical protein
LLKKPAVAAGFFMGDGEQKIAACGSSYRGTHNLVGAAAGCDLFNITSN